MSCCRTWRSSSSGRFDGIGARTIPSTVFVDVEGRVAARVLGLTDAREIAALAGAVPVVGSVWNVRANSASVQPGPDRRAQPGGVMALVHALGAGAAFVPFLRS